MNEYYYSKLQCNEQVYYKKILDAISKGESNVKLFSFVNSEVMTRIVTAVNYDHPELFFVDFRHLNFLGTPLGVVYQINYNVGTGRRTILIDELERKISGILEMASRNNLQGQYEKCRWIHNYLVKNIRYNYAALQKPDDYPDSFGIRGTLIDGLAVCEGISKTFKLLCDRLGVDALIVFGTSSQATLGVNIDHAWNMVKFNEDYVHVDVTWDIGMSESSRFMRYDYFCISDQWMMIDHIYDSFPFCTTNAYSYFEKRNRVFSNCKELQRYLDVEMQKNSKVLYFKIKKSKCDLILIQKKIQAQVSKTISAHTCTTYYLEMVPNLKQMCFFFRIK